MKKVLSNLFDSQCPYHLGYFGMFLLFTAWAVIQVVFSAYYWISVFIAAAFLFVWIWRHRRKWYIIWRLLNAEHFAVFTLKHLPVGTSITYRAFCTQRSLADVEQLSHEMLENSLQQDANEAEIDRILKSED